MRLDWAPFVDLINRHQHFLLTTHVRPDGDGLGSMLALADTLESRGKHTQMVVASTLPPRYDFLDPQRRIHQFSLPGVAYQGAEAVLILDTGTWNQLGDFGTFLRGLSVPRAVIDHHQTQDDLGALRLVDVSAEATGRLIYEAITALGGPLKEQSAHALFVALAMDTGWFRHKNTTPATFDLAGKLAQAGARVTEAYEALFEKNSVGRLKLTGLVLSRLQLAYRDRVAFSEIRLGDYEVTGAIPQDSEDLINFIRSIPSVAIALFFMEQPRGGVKVSFRSRDPYDVARLAEQFNGGGHRLAAGATLQTSLEEARSLVLQAVGAALDRSS
jgi:phosphoesterase RecJ-like protein